MGETWDFTFTAWPMTETRAEDIFDRLAEAFCGGDHDTQDQCPSGLTWVGSLKPSPPDEAPIEAASWAPAEPLATP